MANRGLLRKRRGVLRQRGRKFWGGKEGDVDEEETVVVAPEHGEGSSRGTLISTSIYSLFSISMMLKAMIVPFWPGIFILSTFSFLIEVSLCILSLRRSYRLLLFFIKRVSPIQWTSLTLALNNNQAIHLNNTVGIGWLRLSRRCSQVSGRHSPSWVSPSHPSAPTTVEPTLLYSTINK